MVHDQEQAEADRFRVKKCHSFFKQAKIFVPEKNEKICLYDNFNLYILRKPRKVFFPHKSKFSKSKNFDMHVGFCNLKITVGKNKKYILGGSSGVLNSRNVNLFRG